MQTKAVFRQRMTVSTEEECVPRDFDGLSRRACEPSAQALADFEACA